jgi:hypothetical protein
MTSDSETSSCEGDEENEANDLHPPQKRKFTKSRYTSKSEEKKRKVKKYASTVGKTFIYRRTTRERKNERSSNNDFGASTSSKPDLSQHEESLLESNNSFQEVVVEIESDAHGVYCYTNQLSVAKIFLNFLIFR